MAASQLLANRAQTAPIGTLFLFFVTWKLLLFVLAAISPGIGYDTSTSLLLFQNDPASLQKWSHQQPHKNQSLSTISKLARWDAIYFASIAQRGYLYEQEWAFGLGHTKHLGVMSNIVQHLLHFSDPPILVVGVALSHTYHLLSVVALYFYSKTLFSPDRASTSSVPFVAAATHIISPAGLFLSAPYAESLTSFLTFSGCYLYSQGAISHLNGHFSSGNVLTVLAGALFGVATSVRSNALFNGLLFLCDSLRLYRYGLKNLSDRGLLARQLSLNCGGVCIALGFILPQCLGYLTYCTGGSQQRPWCEKSIPSIYSWVQSYYWNVGFLRYWTISNIPLFLLAAPTLAVLFISGWDVVKGHILVEEGLQKGTHKQSLETRQRVLRLSALPQLVLAFMTLTNAHIQIVTRLASGASCWYQWLSVRLLRTADIASEGKNKAVGVAIRWMVIYALIQGGLFASFLPPA